MPWPLIRSRALRPMVLRSWSCRAARTVLAVRSGIFPVSKRRPVSPGTITSRAGGMSPRLLLDSDSLSADPRAHRASHVGIRPDRADGTRREGDAEWLDPGWCVSVVGWLQVARPGACGVSRAGSSRTPCHLFRMGEIPGWRTRGYSAASEGGENRSISEISAEYQGHSRRLPLERWGERDVPLNPTRGSSRRGRMARTDMGGDGACQVEADADRGRLVDLGVA